MLNNLKNRKKEQGFTIIEVLIVLAIAGLILLVVFLAVPALQRNQRNNGRTSEASRLGSSISNFVSNNQGSNPASAADVTSILSDFGTFKYMNGIGATGVLGSGLTAKMTAGSAVLVVGTAASTGLTPAAVTADAIVINTYAKCGPPSTSMTTTVGTARQLALIYSTESAGGNWNEVCIQVQ